MEPGTQPDVRAPESVAVPFPGGGNFGGIQLQGVDRVQQGVPRNAQEMKSRSGLLRPSSPHSVLSPLAILLFSWVL